MINRKMFTDEEKNERLSNFIDFIQDVQINKIKKQEPLESLEFVDQNM